MASTNKHVPPHTSETQLDEALEETFPASDPPSALLREEEDETGPVAKPV